MIKILTRHSSSAIRSKIKAKTDLSSLSYHSLYIALGCALENCSNTFLIVNAKRLTTIPLFLSYYPLCRLTLEMTG